MKLIVTMKKTREPYHGHVFSVGFSSVLVLAIMFDT